MGVGIIGIDPNKILEKAILSFDNAQPEHIKRFENLDELNNEIKTNKTDNITPSVCMGL